MAGWSGILKVRLGGSGSASTSYDTPGPVSQDETTDPGDTAGSGSVLARDIDGQPFWYVPEAQTAHTAQASTHHVNGKAAA